MNIIRSRIFGFLLLGLLFSGLACSQGEPPEGDAVPMNLGGDAQSSGGGELNLTPPEGWIEEQPSSQMRYAQYRLPGDAGDAEVAVFTGIGGSARQNVDRWVGQFQAPGGGSAADLAEIETKEIAGHQVTTVDVSGTYSGAMAPMAGGGGEAQEGQRMLAAVIESGGSSWFVKLTGPESTVDQWEDSFEEYLNSLN